MRIPLFPLVIVSLLLFAGCDLLDDNKPNPEIPGKIVFSKFENDNEDEIQVFKMNTDGSGLKKLTNFAEGCYEPSWSPDGSQIVFTTSKKASVHAASIYLMNADGSNKRPMKINSDEFGLPYSGSNPIWSPDGSRIAFDNCISCSFGGSNYEIFIYDFEIDSVIRLTNNYWVDRRPVWSPDGSKIAFTTETAYVDSGLTGFQQDIYTMDLESGALTRITETGNANAPNWSPDGRFIAYQTSAGGEQAYIYDFESDQSTLLLPDFRTSYGVQWSKDGTMMLIQASGYEEIADQSRYYKFSEGEYEIIHIELDPFQPVRGNYKWFN